MKWNIKKRYLFPKKKLRNKTIISFIVFILLLVILVLPGKEHTGNLFIADRFPEPFARCFLKYKRKDLFQFLVIIHLAKSYPTFCCRKT